MDLSAHLQYLNDDGSKISRLCRAHGLASAVPSCPGWSLDTLIRHLGGVHRWAVAAISTRADERPAFVRPDEELVDKDLLAWFDDGLEQLATAIAAGPEDLQCWTFLPAPSPLRFWARRQAHETAVHRVDVEQAVSAISSVEADFAVDGIDELLVGFWGRLKAGEHHHVLSVETTDTGDRWLVELGPESVTATRSATGDADCTFCASAETLYLALWNRIEPPAGSIGGDAGVLRTWRDLAKI